MLFKDKTDLQAGRGTAGAELHQDWIAWPGFPESFLTVLLAIDPFTADSGATEVYPRCHTRGYLSPKDGQHHYVELGDLPTEPVPLLLEPGDLAIFTCFTPHRSAAELHAQPRAATSSATTPARMAATSTPGTTASSTTGFGPRHRSRSGLISTSGDSWHATSSAAGRSRRTFRTWAGGCSVTAG